MEAQSPVSKQLVNSMVADQKLTTSAPKKTYLQAATSAITSLFSPRSFKVDLSKLNVSPVVHSTIAERLALTPRSTRRKSGATPPLVRATKTPKSKSRQTKISPIAASLTKTTAASPAFSLLDTPPLSFNQYNSSSADVDNSAFPRSISSRCMSYVMNVRNSAISSIWSKVFHVAKVAVSETALPFLTVSATIESIVYYALLQSASGLSRWTPSVQSWCKNNAIPEKALSANFTISWSFFMLKHNLSFAPLPVHEEDARKFFANKTP